MGLKKKPVSLKFGHNFTIVYRHGFGLRLPKIANVSRETILPQSENKACLQPVSVLVALLGGWTIQPDRLFSAQPIGCSGI